MFTAFGLVLGPLGLGVLSLEIDAELLSTLAELTLALVLFTDASNTNLKVLKKSLAIPKRLLLIGLPLTILLGFGAGYLVFDSLTLIEIAIIATMLAPTDAALGKAVVTNESVPSNVRESLNVESGLNDGICVPILFIFLALTASAGGEGGGAMLAVKLVVQAIGIGAVVGAGPPVIADVDQVWSIFYIYIKLLFCVSPAAEYFPIRLLGAKNPIGSTQLRDRVFESNIHGTTHRAYRLGRQVNVLILPEQGQFVPLCFEMDSESEFEIAKGVLESDIQRCCYRTNGGGTLDTLGPQKQW